MRIYTKNSNHLNNSLTPKQHRAAQIESVTLWVILVICVPSLVLGWRMISKSWDQIYELNQLQQGFLITEAFVIAKEKFWQIKGGQGYRLHYEYVLQPENQSLQTFMSSNSVQKKKYDDTQIGDSVTIIYAISDGAVSQIKQGTEVKSSHTEGWVGIGFGIIWSLLSFYAAYAILVTFLNRKKQNVTETHISGD